MLIGGLKLRNCAFKYLFILDFINARENIHVGNGVCWKQLQLKFLLLQGYEVSILPNVLVNHNEFVYLSHRLVTLN